MCSLVCRLVRGWKQAEATTLISQAATTPGSSLLLQDLSEPDLNVEIGAYAASPYPHIDVLWQPYKYRQNYAGFGSQSGVHSAFCQSFSWPESNTEDHELGKGGSTGSHVRYATASLFCRNGCGDGDSGEQGIFHPPPPRMQVIWCDNNRQASLVTPRVSNTPF